MKLPRRTNTTSASNIFYTLFLLSLFLLPLQDSMLEKAFSASLAWNGFEAFFLAITALFLVYIFCTQSIRPIKQYLLFTLVGSVAMLLVSYAADARPEPIRLLILLAAFWVVPIVRYITADKRAPVIALCLIAITCLHAQWGIAQFIMQSDLSLQLIGEPLLRPDIPGVAKFSVADTKIIRSYGPHPHANSFGGSLLVGILLLSYLHRQSIRPGCKRVCTTSLLAMFFLLYLGVLLSFSRSAYTGLSFFLLIIFLKDHITFSRANASRRIRKLGVWFLENRRLVLPFLFTALLFAPVVFYRASDKESTAALERAEGVVWSMNIFHVRHVFLGVGAGNYPSTLSTYLEESGATYNAWQVDYVHTIPILVSLELGLLAALLLFGLLGYAVFSSQKNLLFLALLPLFFLDHFFYTHSFSLILIAITASLLSIARQK